MLYNDIVYIAILIKYNYIKMKYDYIKNSVNSVFKSKIKIKFLKRIKYGKKRHKC